MIDLIIDLPTKSFIVLNVSDDRWDCVNIYRKVRDVELKKFGYRFNIIQVSKNQELVHDFTESEYSEFNSDPFLLGTVRFYDAIPGSSVIFKVVAYNQRESFEESFEIKIPKLEKPYPSWTWDEYAKKWVAPVPEPELLWDEESMSWHLP